MDSNNDAGRCGKLLRHIDVEAGLGGGGAERGNLLKAAGRHCALSDGGSSGDRKAAREEGEETHCAGSVDVSWAWDERCL
jgi:hypothetical protein